MALPTVNSLGECADYYKTVEPFLPQLYDLPTRVLDNISDGDALLKLYLETNPLISAGAFSLFISCVFFVAAEFNRNFSQVDRAWSILPAIYNAHFAIWARLSGAAHQRNDLITLFTVIWSVRSIPTEDHGARLTSDVYRRG